MYSFPFKGLYFNVNLILVLISVILTIIVLNFHFRGPKKKRVPKWMRKYIIGYIGFVFCFYNESEFYFKNDHHKQSKRSEAASTKLFKNECLNNAKNDLKNNEAADLLSKDVLDKEKDSKVNRAEKCTVQIRNCKTTEPSACSHINMIDSMCDDPREEALTENANDQDETIMYLEETLFNIEKTYLRSKLKDNRLKYLILKEILECQERILLDSNRSTHSDSREITQSEIYDEWKVLAMILDRVCFFIYFIVLLLSSILFVL